MKGSRKDRSISLVTGGAGFIGSHVADHLLNMNHKVLVLDDLSGGFLSNVNKKAVFIEGSVNDRDLLEEIFQKYKIDYIYHLAAYAAEGMSHFIRNFNYNNNLTGSVNLINMAVRNKVKRFIFTSSIAVYGKNQVPMTEDLVPMPEDPYGIAKYAIELDLKAAHEMFGLEYTVLRPHNVYGSRQNHGDPYRNVLGIFINRIFAGKPLTVFGDGMQTRAFSHISDVAPHIANCINVPGTKCEVFNIGADKPYTVLELAENICDVMGVEQNILHLDARNEVVHAHSDHSKANKAFRVKQTTPLRNGLVEMIEWSKKVGYMTPTKLSTVEVFKNMPPSWKKGLVEGDTPLISFIILNQNGKKWLKKCINSIIAQTSKDFEVLFVDSLSTDGSLEYVKRNFPGVKAIHITENQGYAGNNNVAAEHAQGDFLVFLNSDTWFDESFVSKVAHHIEKNNETVLIRPKLKYYEKSRKNEEVPVSGTDVFSYPTVTDKPFYADGACFIIKKPVFEKLGGFDSRYFRFMEDIDLSWRVMLLGHKLTHLTDAVVHHKFEKTMGGKLSKDIKQHKTTATRRFLSEKNSLANILKNYELINVLWIVPVFLGLNLAESMLHLVSGNFEAAGAVFKALLWNIQHIGSTLEERKKVQTTRKASDKAILAQMIKGVGKWRAFQDVGGVPSFE